MVDEFSADKMSTHSNQVQSLSVSNMSINHSSYQDLHTLLSSETTQNTFNTYSSKEHKTQSKLSKMVRKETRIHLTSNQQLAKNQSTISKKNNSILTKVNTKKYESQDTNVNQLRCESFDKKLLTHQNSLDKKTKQEKQNLKSRLENVDAIQNNQTNNSSISKFPINSNLTSLIKKKKFVPNNLQVLSKADSSSKNQLETNVQSENDKCRHKLQHHSIFEQMKIIRPQNQINDSSLNQQTKISKTHKTCISVSQTTNSQKSHEQKKTELKTVNVNIINTKNSAQILYNKLSDDSIGRNTNFSESSVNQQPSECKEIDLQKKVDQNSKFNHFKYDGLTMENSNINSQCPLLTEYDNIQSSTVISNTRETQMENKITIKVKNEIKQEEEIQSVTKALFHQSPERRLPLSYEYLQFVLQDHNYGAPPPRTPSPQLPLLNAFNEPNIRNKVSSTIIQQNSCTLNEGINHTTVDDDTASAVSSEVDREVELEGEETETAPEGEGDDEDSITRCICDFEHDDGYMICCDQCFVWQHVDCMGIDRSNIPEEYLCEVCQPRRIDRARARALQMRKREELLNSDTSSDSSSSCSADIISKRPSRNRKYSHSQLVLQNKSDTQSQTRQTNKQSNYKKHRKDALIHQVSTAVTTMTTAITIPSNQITRHQRGIIKRKTKMSINLDDKNRDIRNSSELYETLTKQWNEKYEEALTNHYRQELRNKISSIKCNGAPHELKQCNITSLATKKYRLSIRNNKKFLVATMFLPANTPVLELRGKYMLSSQYKSSYTAQNRQNSQRSEAFVFFYRLPRDNIEVCVDTTTYGNDARFIRRSCKPNAEIRHCIEKGTLYLYIVTSTSVEKDIEITIRHDQYDFLMTSNFNSMNTSTSCACNNIKSCQHKSLNLNNLNKEDNDAFIENNDKQERRRRGKKIINEQKIDTSSANVKSILTSSKPIILAEKCSSTTLLSTRKSVVNNKSRENTNVKNSNLTSSYHDSNCNTNITDSSLVIKQISNEEPSSVIFQGQSAANEIYTCNKTSTSVIEPKVINEKIEKRKLTREERKMEAIMKAFERLEKAEQKKQEVQARNALRKESGSIPSDNDDLNHPIIKSKQIHVEKIPRRKKRKGRTRSMSVLQTQAMSRTRLNSAESDIITSGDENNSTTSSSLIKQKISNAEVSQPSTSVDAGLLLALSSPNDPGCLTKQYQQELSSHQRQSLIQQPLPIKSPSDDSGNNSNSQSSIPSTPLSSACLLVAAAVEPLTSDFKFPKTKKLLMNEWLKEEQPSLTSNSQFFETSCVNHSEQSREYLSQSCTSKSLATLVQAAHSISDICNALPQCNKQEFSLCSSVNSACITSSGSAKKRWLRQAISEECDSPISNRLESPPSEMVAPPKKRRKARESLSSDNYTPPTTPTMIMQDNMPLHRSSTNEDDINKRRLSPTTQDLESQNSYQSNKIKEYEIKLESEDEMSTNHMKNNFPSRNNPSNSKCKLDLSHLEIDTNDLCEISKIEKENKLMSNEILKNDIFEVSNKNENDIEISRLTDQFQFRKFKMDLEETSKSPLKLSENLITAVTINKNKTTVSLQYTVENKCHHTVPYDKYNVKAQIKKINSDDEDNHTQKLNLSIEKNNSIKKIQELQNLQGDFANSVGAKDVEHCIKTFHGTSFLETIKPIQEPVSISERKDYEAFELDSKPFLLSSEFESRKETKNTFEQDTLNNKVIENVMFHESSSFKEKNLETSKNFVDNNRDNNHYNNKQSQKSNDYTNLTPEESILQLDSMELPLEHSSTEPRNIFTSIPPLSERIRKKIDPNALIKSKPRMESSIRSTLDLQLAQNDDNIDEKNKFSTALKELLEAKIETEDNPASEITPKTVTTMIDDSKKIITDNHINSSVLIKKLKEYDKIQSSFTLGDKDLVKTISAVKEEFSPSEQTKLKDPRTVVPNRLVTSSLQKSNLPAPAKRKLSISEYRKRKQQSVDMPPEPDNVDILATSKSTIQDKSDSTSSGTSSLSSDEENTMKLPTELSNVCFQPTFNMLEMEEKKGCEEGTIGWSAAPTLVERQRENLTERLKREFGLFLNDDEEEKTKKQGLCKENLTRSSGSTASVITSCINYPDSGVIQLPPQPYIPPPGTASSHYVQCSPKLSEVSLIQYSNYLQLQSAIKESQDTSISAFEKSQHQTQSQLSTMQHQLLMPQAPPGSNPYPPVPFAESSLKPLPTPVPPPNTSVSIPHYSPTNTQFQIQPAFVYQVSSPSAHKTFCSESASKS